MKLSILIPIYNEITTIAEVLERVAGVLPQVEKERVLVDDGSNDGTREWLNKTFGPPAREAELASGGSASAITRSLQAGLDVKLVFHDRNKGKGGAIQTAMRACSGDVIVIQDADLEYDPHDLVEMYDLIATRRVADVVYGSRFWGRPHRSLFFHHYIGNRLISTFFNILYNQTLSDIEVCYKMFTRPVLETLNITSNDFGFEVQISAQIALHRRWRIYETAISYFGRTYAEGKKINWKDGVKGLWYVAKFRFAPGN